MPNVNIGSILTALALAVTCAQAQQTVQHKGLSTPSATAAAVCSVNVTGSSAGLSTATISCRKGSIIAASDSDTAIALLRQNSTGVNWTTVDSCGLEGGTCLLAICGVSNGGLLDLNLAVAGYVDQTKYMWGVVCIAGYTRVHIKGANVTGNKVAGLVVNGTADVSITNSSFTNNSRVVWHGAAFVAGGNAAVHIAETVFADNWIYDNNPEFNGGALFLVDNTHVSMDNCTLTRNWATYSFGGSIFATDKATLEINNTLMSANVATKGGGLYVGGQAQVLIAHSVLQDNWGSFGGAIHAADSGNVTVIDSELASNYVKDYFNDAMGGACVVNDTAILSIHNSTVRNNEAQSFGGGVAMGSRSAVLRLGQGTQIYGNSAKQGGGLYLLSLLVNMTHAAAITMRNKAVVSDDIGVPLKRLQLLSERNISSFVPRLSVNKGMLPVRLKLTGTDNLPGSAAIQAVLDGRPLARNSSSAVTGEALLNINLQQPLGTYRLVFEVMAMNDISTDMTVTVEGCGPGEVNVAGENACNTCPRGSYSLDPQARECSRCPVNAVCDEGFILPERGYWSSSLWSNLTHRCLYPPACNQTLNATQLQQLDDDPSATANSTNAAFMAAQCARGHTGNLCGRCSEGYGQRLSATVGACRPCVDKMQIIVLYILASFASMGFIKLLCYLNAQQDAGMAALASVAMPAGAAVPSGQVQGAGCGCSSPAGAVARLGCGSGLNAADSDAMLLASGFKKGAAKDTQRSVKDKQDELAGATRDSSSVSSAGSAGGPGSAQLQSAVGQTAAQAQQPQKACIGDLLKPFVIYLQWTLVVASMNVEWPHVIAAPFSAVAWLFASSSTATGLDCLLTQHSKLPFALQKVLLGLLMPVALLVILLCIDYALVRTRCRGWRLPVTAPQATRRHGGVLARTAIVLVFFFLPSLLRTAYGMFVCVHLDSAPSAELQMRETFFRFDAVGSFWLLDTDQLCFQGYHRGWAVGLGVPLLLLLCVAVPAGVVGYLWRRRGNLQDTYNLQHYGFLYSSYRPSRYYWEGIVALQSCVILAISVFGSTLETVYQCTLFTAAFGIALVLLAVFKPFAQRQSNSVGIQSLGCLILTTQGALVIAALAAADTDGPDQSTAAAATAVGTVLLSVNIVFVLSFAWRVARLVDWRVVSSTASSVTTAAASKLGSTCDGLGGGCTKFRT